MAKTPKVGVVECLVLIILDQAPDGINAPAVQQRLIAAGWQRKSVVQIFIILQRMQEKKWATSQLVPQPAHVKGRAKRNFRATKLGRKKSEEYLRAIDTIRGGA
jgi:DNA-binding PadR family transcriptional regulator